LTLFFPCWLFFCMSFPDLILPDLFFFFFKHQNNLFSYICVLRQTTTSKPR
jgi:hypothetical protein